MALFVAIVSGIICIGCVCWGDITWSDRTKKVCIALAIITGLICAISAITAYNGRQSDAERAVRNYLSQKGYHVTSADFKSRKGYHNSFWQVDVYRVSDPDCVGTVKVQRYNDRNSMLDDLDC